MLEGGGFEVLDLGVDVPAERFVEAVVKDGAQVVAISALLTSTMPAMADTVAAMGRAGVRQQVKVIIGGAPITPAFAAQIGADGYSDNASSAVQLARRLVAA
jgi:methanogenic corrinoid protein MtbC1